MSKEKSPWRADWMTESPTRTNWIELADRMGSLVAHPEARIRITEVPL
jgi:hypothetical protein